MAPPRPTLPTARSFDQLVQRCVLLTALLIVSVALPACQQKSGPSGDSVQSSAPPAPLPPLIVSDQTKGLLLTWVDDIGDFHVETQLPDIPAANRKAVRVVVSSSDHGTGELVYVLNLSQPDKAGSYRAQIIARDRWEQIGASKRAVRMDQLGAEQRAKATAPPEPSTDGLHAVVYGADWCKPCKDAKKFLKSLGVKVTAKNIEKSKAARAEMKTALSKINRTGASIPVIDVMGTVLVGFSKSRLNQVVAAAAKRAK